MDVTIAKTASPILVTPLAHEDLSQPHILDMREWRKLRRQFGGKPDGDVYGHARYSCWVRSLWPDATTDDKAAVQRNINWFMEDTEDGPTTR